MLIRKKAGEVKQIKVTNFSTEISPMTSIDFEQHIEEGNGDWGLGTGDWGLGIGDWGLGIGDWGLGIGDWGLGTGDWGLGTGNQEDTGTR